MDVIDKLRDHDSDGPVVFTRASTFATLHDTPPHSHARGQLVACERGLITIATRAGTWVVPSRHAIWLPPHVEHGGHTHGSVAGWSLYVAKHVCDGLPTQPCTLAVTPLLWEAAMRASAWGLAALDAASQRIANVIVDELRRLDAQPFELQMPRDQRLARVARALLDNPADARGLDAWARWTGVSPRTLTRRFVTETGLTFSEWLRRARLLRAVEMLARHEPVTTIAIELGYHSVSAFISLFKRTFGVTPSLYMASRSRALPPRTPA